MAKTLEELNELARKALAARDQADALLRSLIADISEQTHESLGTVHARLNVDAYGTTSGPQPEHVAAFLSAVQ